MLRLAAAADPTDATGSSPGPAQPQPQAASLPQQDLAVYDECADVSISVSQLELADKADVVVTGAPPSCDSTALRKGPALHG